MTETVRGVRLVDRAAAAGRRWGLPRGVIILIGMASAVVAFAGIRAIAWLIGPAFLALMIVIAVAPLQGWMLRRGLPAGQPFSPSPSCSSARQICRPPRSR